MFKQVTDNDVDDDILKNFRTTAKNIRNGTIKKSLEIAMLDYIILYSKSKEGKEFAARFKEENPGRIT